MTKVNKPKFIIDIDGIRLEFSNYKIVGNHNWYEQFDFKYSIGNTAILNHQFELVEGNFKDLLNFFKDYQVGKYSELDFEEPDFVFELKPNELGTSLRVTIDSCVLANTGGYTFSGLTAYWDNIGYEELKDIISSLQSFVEANAHYKYKKEG